MRYKYYLTWNMASKTQKHEKWAMHTVGPGLWRENWKSWKMGNTHCRNWNMSRNTEKNVKNRNTHCRTWFMVRKLKKHEKSDSNTVWPGIWRETLKKVENENCTL
jgi:hypothetical protein